MPESSVAAFETTVNKTHQWLKQMQKHGDFADQAQAYAALRAGLHAIRDRLRPEEAAHLGAQLPMLVRGIYYEAWRPAAAPADVRTEQEFLADVRARLGRDDIIDPEAALVSTIRVLSESITPGEIEDIKGSMPKPLQKYWV